MGIKKNRRSQSYRIVSNEGGIDFVRPSTHFFCRARLLRVNVSHQPKQQRHRITVRHQEMQKNSQMCGSFAQRVQIDERPVIVKSLILRIKFIVLVSHNGGAICIRRHHSMRQINFSGLGEHSIKGIRILYRTVDIGNGL